MQMHENRLPTVAVADFIDETLENGSSLAERVLNLIVAGAINWAEAVRDRVVDGAVLWQLIDDARSLARLENVHVTASGHMIFRTERLFTSSSSCAGFLLVDIIFPTD